MAVTISVALSRLGSHQPDRPTVGQAAVLGAPCLTDVLTLSASTVSTIVPVVANTLVAGLPASGPDDVGRVHPLAGPRPAGAVASR
jgi:hypothetical protein